MNTQSQFKTRWNWGAFIDALGFGIGNRTYLCLLILIPFFNIIWAFVVGARAEQWALQNPRNHYQSEQEFREAMDHWKCTRFVQYLKFTSVLALYVFVFATLGKAILISSH